MTTALLVKKLACEKFISHLTGQAHTSLYSQLAGSAMAFYAGHLKMLQTYQKAADFLLRTDATDEVLAERHTDVVTFLQDSRMKEESYSSQLWIRAFRCGLVFPDLRIRLFLVEGLLPASCAQVGSYLAKTRTLNTSPSPVRPERLGTEDIQPAARSLVHHSVTGWTQD